jgi:hypothetical protein
MDYSLWFMVYGYGSGYGLWIWFTMTSGTFRIGKQQWYRKLTNEAKSMDHGPGFRVKGIIER